MSGKGLTSKTHKELIHLNIKKKKNDWKFFLQNWMLELTIEICLVFKSCWHHVVLEQRRKNWIGSLLRRHTDGQQAHEKTLNIANHQRNATQNHKIIPLTCQNGDHQTGNILQVLAKMWKKGNPSALWMVK